MRQLTARQKKVIDKFISSVTTAPHTWERELGVFTEGRNILDIEELPSEVYTLLEKINDTEILYQEVDRYIQDTSNAIYHTIR